MAWVIIFLQMKKTLATLVRRLIRHAGYVLIAGPSSNIYFTRDISNALQRTVQTLEAAGCQIARIQHLDRGVLSVSRPPSPPPMAAMLGRQRQTPRNATMGSEPQESDSYLLPPEGETTPLLKKYFADTGMLFPYLHPPTFMQTYKEIRQERRPVRRTWLALLSMILAITVSTDTEHAIDAKQRQKRSHVFYSRAMQLVGGLTSTHASLETGKDFGLPVKPSFQSSVAKSFSTIPFSDEPISSGYIDFESDLGHAWPRSQGGLATRITLNSSFETLSST